MRVYFNHILYTPYSLLPSDLLWAWSVVDILDIQAANIAKY